MSHSRIGSPENPFRELRKDDLWWIRLNRDLEEKKSRTKTTSHVIRIDLDGEEFLEVGQATCETFDGEKNLIAQRCSSVDKIIKSRRSSRQKCRPERTRTHGVGSPFISLCDYVISLGSKESKDALDQ